jgi:hypothetical protein
LTVLPVITHIGAWPLAKQEHQMITHYTLLSHLSDGSHRIMRGMKMTPMRAKEVAEKWNGENAKNKDRTHYTLLPCTDYCA